MFGSLKFAREVTARHTQPPIGVMASVALVCALILACDGKGSSLNEACLAEAGCAASQDDGSPSSADAGSTPGPDATMAPDDTAEGLGNSNEHVDASLPPQSEAGPNSDTDEPSGDDAMDDVDSSDPDGESDDGESDDGAGAGDDSDDGAGAGDDRFMDGGPSDDNTTDGGRATGCPGCSCRPDFSCDSRMSCSIANDVCVGTEWAPTSAEGDSLLWDIGEWR